MLKKKLFTLGLALTMTMAMSITSFAGWKQDSNGWWWQNNNGTWPANCWQWLDGNNDGIAECYYFDGNGYMLAGTTTPDGYQVNADGAWTVNGAVQTKTVGVSTGGSTSNAGAEQVFSGSFEDFVVQHTGDRYAYDICWRDDQFDDGSVNENGISNFYEREAAYINSQKATGFTPGTTNPNSVNTIKETGQWVIDTSHANATSGESNIRFKLDDGTYAGEGWHRIQRPNSVAITNFFFSPNGYLVRNAKVLSDKRTVYISVNTNGTWIDGNYEYVK